LGIVVGAAVLTLPGCNRPEATPSPADDRELVTGADSVSAKPARAPEPAPTATLDAPALLARLAAADTMLAWYDVQAAYQAQGGGIPEVDAALAAREAELLAKTPALLISEELDLIAVNWKLDGIESAEGKEEAFLVTWLFRPKKDIVQEAGHDVRLVLRGWFDKAHQQYFAADEKYFQLTYTLKPPVADWEAGSYQLVKQKTYRKVPNIPYRLHTFFTKVRKTEEGDWVPQGRYGQIADSGWKADLGDATVAVGSN